MRVISGKARGTKLYTLKGEETRPTLDRVKESLFNIINDQITDSTVIDLFSGSGAIGLEFASRGAKKVYLCDNSKFAMEIIKKNIEKTHLEEKVITYNCDYKEALQKVDKEEINIIYLDPPYKTNYIKYALEEIIKEFKKDLLIIVETDDKKRIEEQLKELESSIKIIDHRKYGRANLLFIRKDK